VVPLTVVFTDTSTGTIATRDWNFGDGQTLPAASSAPISHTYLTTGALTVALTATNPGGSDTASTLITVTEQTPPFLVADFEDLDLGNDPTFWLDQAGDSAPLGRLIANQRRFADGFPLTARGEELPSSLIFELFQACQPGDGDPGLPGNLLGLFWQQPRWERLWMKARIILHQQVRILPPTACPEFGGLSPSIPQGRYLFL
jgi:PKD repeat protein